MKDKEIELLIENLTAKIDTLKKLSLSENSQIALGKQLGMIDGFEYALVKLKSPSTVNE